MFKLNGLGLFFFRTTNADRQLRCKEGQRGGLSKERLGAGKVVECILCGCTWCVHEI